MSVSPTPMTTKLQPFPAGPPQELLLSSAFLIKRLGMMIKESSLAALEPTGLTPPAPRGADPPRRGNARDAG